MSDRQGIRLHVQLSLSVAQALDEVVRMSDGALDRARAAELAMQMGLAALAERTAAEAAQRIAECLRCDAQMHGADAEGVSFKGCGHCGGIWLDNLSAALLFDSLPAKAVELARRATEATTGTAGNMAELDCPVCDQRMAHRQPEGAPIRLDICAKHGTWFDGGELVQTLDVLLERQRKRAELAGAVSDAALDAELAQLDEIYEGAFKDGLWRGQLIRGY